MRTLYAEKQQLLVETVRRELSGLMKIAPAEAGMHLLGWLSKDVDDRAVVDKAAQQGASVAPLSAFATTTRPPPALVLGCTSMSEVSIRVGIRRLARALAP